MSLFLYYLIIVILICLLAEFTVYVHELGHYYVAKKQNRFVRWKHVPLVHQYIEIKGCFNSRWDYLYGILFSFATIPLWILFGFEWYIVLLGYLGIGCLDLRDFVRFNKIKELVENG